MAQTLYCCGYGLGQQVHLWFEIGKCVSSNSVLSICWGCSPKKTKKKKKCPLTEEWIKKMWYIYAVEYYSALKRMKYCHLLQWMDLMVIILSEVSQTKTNIMWYHLHVESNTKWCRQTYLQNRNRLTDFENELLVTKGQQWGVEITWEFGINIYTLLYIK